MDPTSPRPSAPRWRLPRTRGDGPLRPVLSTEVVGAPPHTRGWTLLDHLPRLRDGGSPAHAGMDPILSTFRPLYRGLPRTRGDGPGSVFAEPAVGLAPPHTRGWTRFAVDVPGRRAGSPAHAGMDPSHRRWPPEPPRLPRTRGDGPIFPSVGSRRPRLPRTRGDGPWPFEGN